MQPVTLRRYPVADHAPFGTSNYFELTPGDIVGLIAPYVFADWRWSVDDSKTILTAPEFTHLVARCPVDEMHWFLTQREIEPGNLLNYILPVERLVESSFRTRVLLLNECLGYTARMATRTWQACNDFSGYESEYLHMYFLFLLYFSEHGGCRGLLFIVMISLLSNIIPVWPRLVASGMMVTIVGMI